MIPPKRVALLLCVGAVLAPLSPGLVPGPVPIEAQSLTRGAVEGTITDGAEPQADVAVTLREVDGIYRRTLRSAYDGTFRFHLVPPGAYVVEVERFGYRPYRKSGVQVRAGDITSLAFPLTREDPPVENVDEVERRSAVGGDPGGGLGARVEPFALEGLPPETGHWLEARRLISSLSDDGGAVGLPAALTGLAVDGLAAPVPQQPDGQRGALAGMAYPTSFFQEIAYLDLPYDVEWRDGTGGLFHGTTRRGTEEIRTRVHGTWSGAEVRDRPDLPDGLPDHHDLDAGAVVTGPAIPDTLHFAAGVHTRRQSEPLPAYLDLQRGEDDRLASALTQVSGDALESFWSPAVARWQTLALFGRADWRISHDHTLSARTHVAGAWGSDSDLTPTPVMAPGTDFGGWDLSTGAALTSHLADWVWMETRVGLDVSTRDPGARTFWDADANFSGPIPATLTTSTGRVLGSNPLGADEVDQRVLRATQTFQFALGNHRIKAGVGLAGTHHSIRDRYERDGIYRFGGADELLAGRGSYAVRTGGDGAQSFGISELTAFLQDTWTPNPHLEVTGGIRLERVGLPVDDIAPAEAWLTRTGIDNTELAASAQELHASPRGAFRWDVEGDGVWTVKGGAGVFRHLPDPGTLDEALRYTGDVEAHRGVGAVQGWPEAPTTGAVEERGPVLAMLGPNFQGPWSQRASLGVEYRPFRHTAVQLSGSWVRTRALPRRSDLNLRDEPLEEDQFGRPLYGELRKEGSLLAVRPGSDRRDPAFDMVSALEADGRSRAASVTLGLQHRNEGLFEVFGAYTLSDVTDNRPGSPYLGASRSLVPRVPGAGNEAWEEGPADLHVRHQMAAAGEVTVPFPIPLRVGARYRARSGQPFTPSFPQGVQAGAHLGSEGDPAYVAHVADVAALASHWSCLEDQLGQWAQRNSCRGSWAHDLDVRFTVGILNGERASAELLVDAVNILGRDRAVPDPALFRVDPVRPMSRHPGSGRVTVPLQVNPHFGEPLFREHTARGLRLGVSARF